MIINKWHALGNFIRKYTRKLAEDLQIGLKRPKNKHIYVAEVSEVEILSGIGIFLRLVLAKVTSDNLLYVSLCQLVC